MESGRTLIRLGDPNNAYIDDDGMCITFKIDSDFTSCDQIIFSIRQSHMVTNDMLYEEDIQHRVHLTMIDNCIFCL